MSTLDLVFVGGIDRGHPPHAERLDLNKCMKTLERQSDLAPQHTAFETRFSCPSCDVPLPTPPHLRNIECPACALRMRACVADLFIWRDTPEARRA